MGFDERYIVLGDMRRENVRCELQSRCLLWSMGQLQIVYCSLKNSTELPNTINDTDTNLEYTRISIYERISQRVQVK